jgi:hypothetical protein
VYWCSTSHPVSYTLNCTIHGVCSQNGTLHPQAPARPPAARGAPRHVVASYRIYLGDCDLPLIVRSRLYLTCQAGLSIANRRYCKAHHTCTVCLIHRKGCLSHADRPERCGAVHAHGALYREWGAGTNQLHQPRISRSECGSICATCFLSDTHPAYIRTPYLTLCRKHRVDLGYLTGREGSVYSQW